MAAASAQRSDNQIPRRLELDFVVGPQLFRLAGIDHLLYKQTFASTV